MLADTMPGSDAKNYEERWTKCAIAPGIWAVEEKLDGHRVIVEILEGVGTPGLPFEGESDQPKTAKMWSRDGLSKSIPSHMMAEMIKLPVGIYDGELLVPGQRSYGVTRLTTLDKLVFVMFDVLELLGTSTMDVTYDNRRKALEMLAPLEQNGAVRLVKSHKVDSMGELRLICETVWSRDGEGVIVKRRDIGYHPNKRKAAWWMKVKALQSAVLTVVGFVPSRGTKVDRGPFAMVMLEDAEGHRTAVKTRNDAELQNFMVQWRSINSTDMDKHPAIGRKLRVDYQERTPDGSYRHIRWDRWEDE
jgi:ATP-dependent DNA ligase